MIQTVDYQPYHIDCLYRSNKYKKSWQVGRDYAEFEETDTLCQGIARHISRKIILNGNRLEIRTSVKNIANQSIVLNEYNHNFLAIDGIPIGKGYRLEIPYDCRLSETTKTFRNQLTDLPIVSPVTVTDQTVIWHEDMTERTFFIMSENSDLSIEDRYFWRISYDGSPASITGISGFRPQKICIWRIEHCICPEIYHQMNLLPGKEEVYSRVWIFDDEITETSD